MFVGANGPKGPLGAIKCNKLHFIANDCPSGNDEAAEFFYLGWLMGLWPTYLRAYRPLNYWPKMKQLIIFAKIKSIGYEELHLKRLLINIFGLKLSLSQIN